MEMKYLAAFSVSSGSQMAESASFFHPACALFCNVTDITATTAATKASPYKNGKN